MTVGWLGVGAAVALVLAPGGYLVAPGGSLVAVSLPAHPRAHSLVHGAGAVAAGGL